MVLEEVVEILDGFLEVAALIENLFGDFYQGAFLVGYDGGSPWHVVNEWNLAEGVTGVVVDIFFLPPVLLVLTLDAVDPLENDVEILALIPLLEDDLMDLMVL